MLKLESDRIALPTQAAIDKLKEEGKRWCNHAPLGFRWSKDGYKEPDLHDQAIMAQLLDWREAGATYDVLFYHLLKLKVKTSRGGEWHWSRIHRAVQVARELRAKGELHRDVAG